MVWAFVGKDGHVQASPGGGAAMNTHLLMSLVSSHHLHLTTAPAAMRERDAELTPPCHAAGTLHWASLFSRWLL